MLNQLINMPSDLESRVASSSLDWNMPKLDIERMVGGENCWKFEYKQVEVDEGDIRHELDHDGRSPPLFIAPQASSLAIDVVWSHLSRLRRSLMAFVILNSFILHYNRLFSHFESVSIKPYDNNFTVIQKLRFNLKIITKQNHFWKLFLDNMIYFIGLKSSLKATS